MNEPEVESDTDVWMNGGWKTEQYWRTHHRRPADLSREPSAKPRHGETRRHYHDRIERARSNESPSSAGELPR